jgi:hypothetical protein
MLFLQQSAAPNIPSEVVRECITSCKYLRAERKISF